MSNIPNSRDFVYCSQARFTVWLFQRLRKIFIPYICDLYKPTLYVTPTVKSLLHFDGQSVCSLNMRKYIWFVMKCWETFYFSLTVVCVWINSDIIYFWFLLELLFSHNNYGLLMSTLSDSGSIDKSPIINTVSPGMHSLNCWTLISQRSIAVLHAEVILILPLYCRP